MYLKHLNQTNRTMNVTIEHVFCRYSDEAEEIYFRIMNTILFATDETELRASMERLKNETCLLYTSDAADDTLRVDLGGRRIIKKIF